MPEADFARKSLNEGEEVALHTPEAIEAFKMLNSPFKDPTEHAKIDNFMVQELDGTTNEWDWCKQKLGANAILAVSLAVCKARAMVKKLSLYQHIANLAGNKTLVLPIHAFNVINGGEHVGIHDSSCWSIFFQGSNEDECG